MMVLGSDVPPLLNGVAVGIRELGDLSALLCDRLSTTLQNMCRNMDSQVFVTPVKAATCLQRPILCDPI